MRHAEVIDASLDVDGKFGSGIEFDTFEANESLAEMAQLSLLQNELKFSQANWTVSLWFESPIKIQSPHAQVGEYILTYGDADSGFVFVENEADDTFTNYEPQRLSLDRGIENRRYSDFLLNTLGPGWRNLVIRSSVGKTEFYIDGAYQDEVNAHINLDIGTIGNTPFGGNRFAPKMDDFRVYDRSLSASEIETLYGGGNGDFGVHPYAVFPPTFDNVPVILPPRNPIVYWTFNELNGTQVRDDSGKSNHGFF